MLLPLGRSPNKGGQWPELCYSDGCSRASLTPWVSPLLVSVLCVIGTATSAWCVCHECFLSGHHSLFPFWCILSHKSFVTCLSLCELQSFVCCIGSFFHSPLTKIDFYFLHCSVTCSSRKNGTVTQSLPLTVVWPQRLWARAAGTSEDARTALREGGSAGSCRTAWKPTRLGTPSRNSPTRLSSRESSPSCPKRDQWPTPWTPQSSRSPGGFNSQPRRGRESLLPSSSCPPPPLPRLSPGNSCADGGRFVPRRGRGQWGRSRCCWQTHATQPVGLPARLSSGCCQPSMTWPSSVH